METIHAVPLDALFFCHFDRLDLLNETFTNSSSNWNVFTDSTGSLFPLLRHMEQNASKNKAAANILSSKTVVSAHLQGKNEIAYLWLISIPPSVTHDEWLNFLKTFPQPVKTEAYEDRTIHTIGDNEQAIYCCILKDIFICSRSLITLQSSIRQVESGTYITDDEQFTEVMGSVGTYVDIRFFMNHRMIQKILPTVGSDIVKKHAPFLSYTANWSALDGQMMPNMIHLSGFTFPSFTNDNYLSCLLTQEGATIAACEFLPENTAAMLSTGFSDISRFFTSYRHYLEVRKELVNYQKQLTIAEENWQRKADEMLSSIYPKELAIAYIPNAGWVSILRTGNIKYAEEQFREMAEKADMRDYSSSSGIFRNPMQGLLPTIFGEIYATSGDAFFKIHGDWLIFADSLQTLERFSARRNNLKTRMSEMKASQYINDNASFMVCIQSTPSRDYNEAFLSFLNPTQRKKVEDGLKKNPPGMACVQLRPLQDKLYANFCAFFAEEFKASEKETVEDSSKKPEDKKEELKDQNEPTQAKTSDNHILHKFSVINHYTKEKETLIQRADNAIALLDPKNVSLWEKKYNGAIIDTAIQIDFFKNGKLQMLFATANQLHLIDRNGNTVAPFPLAISPKVIHGVAVFDYEKNREYRIFLVHEDNTIRVYDKKGRPVSGFKPFKTKSLVVRAPEFVRVGGRDYILVFDTQNMYILDRQGNERTKVQQAVAIDPRRPIEIQQSPHAVKLYTNKGVRVEVGLRDGKVK